MSGNGVWRPCRNCVCSKLDTKPEYATHNTTCGHTSSATVRFIAAAAIAALALIDLSIILLNGISLDPVYLAYVTIWLTTLGFGIFLRIRQEKERFSLAFIAISLFNLFMISAVIFSELLQPVGNRLIDIHLMRADAMLGFKWDIYVEAFKGHADLSHFLAFIYGTSIYQLLTVIVFLTVTRNQKLLLLLLVTGMLTSLMTILIWYIFPSVGPASFYKIAPQLENELGLILGSEMGQRILEDSFSTTQVITPNHRRVLVAIPSFHMVMVLLSCWYLSRNRLAQAALILLNIPMIPAILLHGSHHLVDLPAGIAVFLASHTLSKRVLAHPFMQTRKHFQTGFSQ